MKIQDLKRILQKINNRIPELPETNRIPSAVIIPFVQLNNEAHIMFIRKTEDGSPHAGQVSFPGGCKEEGEDIKTTALREFEEETGIPKEKVEIIGFLKPVPTKSTPFIIFPFIGMVEELRDLNPNKKEVSRVFFVPFDFLYKRYPFEIRDYHYKGRIFRTPLIEYEGEIIWGATARILEVLMEEIRRRVSEDKK